MVRETHKTQMTRLLVVLEVVLAGGGILELWRVGGDNSEAILTWFECRDGISGILSFLNERLIFYSKTVGMIR